MLNIFNDLGYIKINIFNIVFFVFMLEKCLRELMKNGTKGIFDGVREKHTGLIRQTSIDAVLLY